MKFAFTADIHLSRYGQDSIDNESGLPERLNSIINSLDYMANYCLTNSIKNIIIGGDLLHGKSIIYALAQDIMIRFFNKYNNIKFWVIDGNHDLSSKGEDSVSALRSLESISNVIWISQTTQKFENILFIPYSRNVVEQVKNEESDILISHFGLSEGVLNSGISIISSIGMSDLRSKYKLVLLGHYHKPQKIIESDISMYYVGSPIQLDWGEKGDQKRFLIIDTKTLEVKSILTKGYKKFIELELTSKNKEEVMKIAKDACEQGHYIKLLKTEKVDTKGFENLNIVDKTEKDITNRGITSTMSQKEKLERYLEIKEIPKSEQKEYLEIGLKIIDSTQDNL